MMQGDAYSLAIRVLNSAGEPVTSEDIQDIEITIGKLRKTYLDAQLTFSDGVWLFPLTQEETHRYWPSAIKAQVRVKWANGFVEGKPLYGVRIDESLSKEVL